MSGRRGGGAWVVGPEERDLELPAVNPLTVW